MPNKLVISGYGWLAGYLAASVKDEYSLVATSRSEEKVGAIKAQGIEGVQFTLGDPTSVLTKHLSGATFVINIPPGRRSTNLETFTKNMLSLIDDAIAANVSHIVFISTTSVYGDATSNRASDIITENSPTSPETASAHAHVTIENRLLTLSEKVKVSIVRLAGLVGPDRHPAKSLSGRDISAGNKRVNLVYILDVVEALKVIITKPLSNKVFQLCSSAHPKRGDYYVKAAQAFNIPEPTFSDTELAPCGKVINAEKSWKEVGISPTYADPYDMY